MNVYNLYKSPKYGQKVCESVGGRQVAKDKS